MKKVKIAAEITLALFLISLASMAFVPVAMGHTAGDPFVTDLIADGGDPTSAVDVGDVLVWNDEDFLYVKYVTDGWYITEVHLQVASNLFGIPQSNGNPVPGKFTYGEKGLWTQEYEFEPIPLNSWTAGTTLYIAAHAKVMTESMRATISAVTDLGFSGFDSTSGFSTTDTMANLGTSSLSLLSGFGQLTGYYGTVTATLTHRGTRGLGVVFGEQDEVDRQNIANPERIEVAFTSNVYVDWLEVRSLFIKTDEPPYNVPEEAEVLFYKDGVLVNTERLVAVEPITPGKKGILRVEYTTPYEADFLVFRVPEPFTGRNEFAVAALEVYQLREETAWGAGTAFPGKNWATYFTYKVQEVLVDTVTVLANDVDGENSHIVLDPSKQYRFVVTGSYWRNTGGSPNQLCDAEYTTYEDWEDWSPYHDGCLDYTAGWLAGWTWLGANFADLQVDGGFVDWGPFSSTHEYTYMFGAGTGSTVNFRIFDGSPDGTQVPGWYNDNRGSLAVEIYWVG